MQADAANHDLRALESLLAFWSEAGVEVCTADEPIDRRIPIAPPPRAAAPTPLRPAAPLVPAAPEIGEAVAQARAMAAAAGLHDRVFITNTVFWRPPGNRTPTFGEQTACAPFVERAIELVQPRLLLLVGGASAKFMLGKDEGILSLRGRWFEWRSHNGETVLPALPTLHPAFLLRQPAAKKRAWADLLTLSERLDRQARPA